MKKFWVAALLISLIVTAYSISFNDIVESSLKLKTVELLVYAENHVGSRKSIVEFKFWYQRNGKKMRIEYISPKNMKGTIVAIDGEYFYNYIASLNRKIKRKISGNTKNPGKDMGILYNYVLGDLTEVQKSSVVKYIKEENLKINDKTIKTWLFEIKRKGGITEKVWFDEETLFPVKIDIYKHQKLSVILIVKEWKINIELDQKLFSPF